MATFDSFLSIHDVLKQTSIKSRSTVYVLIAEGKFPKPYPITTARRAWSAREISDWIEGRKAAA